MKMKNKLKKLWTRTKDNAEDACDMIMDFQDEHPFLFGHFVACVAIYWALVIDGYCFHPGKVLGWIDKK